MINREAVEKTEAFTGWYLPLEFISFCRHEIDQIGFNGVEDERYCRESSNKKR